MEKKNRKKGWKRDIMTTCPVDYRVEYVPWPTLNKNDVIPFLRKANPDGGNGNFLMPIIDSLRMKETAELNKQYTEHQYMIMLFGKEHAAELTYRGEMANLYDELLGGEFDEQR